MTTSVSSLPAFIYTLTGDGIDITFNPDPGPPTADGPHVLHYKNGQRELDFHPEQIRSTVVPDLGLCLSVTIEERGDAGSVTATIVFPDVVLASGNTTAVHTILITTTHEIPAAVTLNGQRDDYQITPLTGQAENPAFWPREKAQ